MTTLHIPRTDEEKLKELYEKHKKYTDWLASEMKGYRGVIHESASSEIKHNKVMVLRDMLSSIDEEIKILETKNPHLKPTNVKSK
jgi:hypothetical protein